MHHDSPEPTEFALLPASALSTGPSFRHRIEPIVEKFTDMKADLERQRATMIRLWTKREQQFRGVLDSTAGLYGDRASPVGRCRRSRAWSCR